MLRCNMASMGLWRGDLYDEGLRNADAEAAQVGEQVGVAADGIGHFQHCLPAVGGEEQFDLQ